MKTLNQEELFLVSGGNDEVEEVSVSNDGEAVETVEVTEVVAQTGFFQAAGAFLSKLAQGCCS